MGVGKIGSVLFLLLVLSAGASALGLSYEYLENKTLNLSPGENYYFKLIIQNEEEEDITINLSLQSDIATLIGDQTLTIPAKTFDRFVYFNISVPQDAPIGARYALRYAVTPTERGEGQVPFAVKYDRSIDVLVTLRQGASAPPADLDDVQRESKPWILIIGAGALLVLIFIVVLLWRRSKRLSQQLHSQSRTSPVAADGKQFRTNDGKEFRDLRELLQGLKEMSDAEFHHHVTAHKNDFSTWVKDVLGLQATAEKLEGARTRQAMMRTLEDELR